LLLLQPNNKYCCGGSQIAARDAGAQLSVEIMLHKLTVCSGMLQQNFVVLKATQPGTKHMLHASAHTEVCICISIQQKHLQNARVNTHRSQSHHQQQPCIKQGQLAFSHKSHNFETANPPPKAWV
jgi:hypothetical protein